MNLYAGSLCLHMHYLKSGHKQYLWDKEFIDIMAKKKKKNSEKHSSWKKMPPMFQCIF